MTFFFYFKIKKPQLASIWGPCKKYNIRPLLCENVIVRSLGVLRNIVSDKRKLSDSLTRVKGKNIRIFSHAGVSKRKRVSSLSKERTYQKEKKRWNTKKCLFHFKLLAFKKDLFTPAVWYLRIFKQTEKEELAKKKS